MLNKKLTGQLESREGRVMFCLVREFLEYFNLDFTVSVYEPESYLGSGYRYEGRSKIIQDLGIKQLREDSQSPLLLQLIQIAQSKSSIEIDLSKIHNGGAEDSVETSSSEELEKSDKSEDKEERIASPEVLAHSLSVETSQASKEEVSEATSSISENVSSADLDKTISHLDKSPTVSENEFSPPVLKDSKSDKFKTSPKGDKLKSKSSLSSLADLPPLQLNKPRSNETLLLPSLYNKDFKDKSLNQNLREIDRFFDVELDNYEEDFMSDSDVNLNKSSESSKSNLSRDFDPNKTYDVNK